MRKSWQGPRCTGRYGDIKKITTFKESSRTMSTTILKNDTHRTEEEKPTCKKCYIHNLLVCLRCMQNYSREQIR